MLLQRRQGDLPAHRGPRDRWTVLPAAYPDAGGDAGERYGDEHGDTGAYPAARVHGGRVDRAGNLVHG